MASTSVIAVVPTYRPEPHGLLDLVTSLGLQGIPVVISDDASPCTFDPVLRSCADAGASVVRHLRNAGIARGLNDGLGAALAADASWLLTVDQDSTLPAGYASGMLAAALQAESRLGRGTVGVIGAAILDDASGEVGYPVIERDGVATTHEVFQTGSLWSVRALEEIGGFDESLGIDGVDAAACLALRAAGLAVALAPSMRLAHQYGAGTQVQLLGRTVVSTGHSPARRESMVRNRLRLFPAEFMQSPVHAFRTLRRVGVNTALGVTVEDGKWANAKGSARGLLPRRRQPN